MLKPLNRLCIEKSDWAEGASGSPTEGPDPAETVPGMSSSKDPLANLVRGELRKTITAVKDLPRVPDTFTSHYGTLGAEGGLDPHARSEVEARYGALVKLRDDLQETREHLEYYSRGG